MMQQGRDAKASRNGRDSAADAWERRRQDGCECLAAALDYLALRWSVLAVCPPDHFGVGSTHAKKCKHPGKAPWGEWKTFQDRLPSEEELRKKWHDNPTLNVGMALGPVSELIGIDVDGAAGELKLQELSAGELPRTLEFTTPGGGRRLLYRISKEAKLRPTYQAAGVKAEVRFLAYGSQTVLPPSRHRDSGGRYQWKSGQAPQDIDPANAPAWVLQELASRPCHETNGENGEPTNGGKILEGSRNSVLCSLAGSMRQRGFCQAALEAALVAENLEKCSPPLEEEEVRSIARSVSRYESGPIPGPVGSEIILAYFKEVYHPVFRRGPILFSANLGREVKVSEACQGATTELIERLANAVDGPKLNDNVTADRSKLPQFFRKWVSVAWADLMREMPEEEAAGEVDPMAKEEFEARLADVLNTIVSLGHEHKQGTDTKTRIEQRSLLECCLMFAKPGKWQSIRSYRLWAKKDKERVCIALRAELFGQVRKPALSGRQLGHLAELYELGTRTLACGQRAIELAPTFLADQFEGLRLRPSQEKPLEENSANSTFEGNPYGE